MLKPVRSPFWAALTIAANILWQAPYWFVWLVLDRCCRPATNTGLDRAMAIATQHYATISAVLAGALAIVLLANWRVMVRAFMKVIIKNVVADGGNLGGILVKDATVHADGLKVSNDKNGILLMGSPDSTFKETVVSGSQMPGSVGYDIDDSPRIDMRNAKSKNHTTGFRVRSSPDANLSQTTAEMDSPPAKPDERR